MAQIATNITKKILIDKELPGTISLQNANRFDTVVNAKKANNLGIAIPEKILKMPVAVVNF